MSEHLPQYRVLVRVADEESDRFLNELAAQGYEVVAMSYSGADDRGRSWLAWTLRMSRRARLDELPAVSRLAEFADELDQRLARVEEIMKARGS